MAMHWPDSDIVRVKGDGHFRTWRNRECIAQCSGYLFAVNFHNLEVVPMQMHRMSHAGWISEGNSDALTALDIKRVVIGISCVVDGPNIGSHVSAKRRRD